MEWVSAVSNAAIPNPAMEVVRHGCSRVWLSIEAWIITKIMKCAGDENCQKLRRKGLGESA